MSTSKLINVTIVGSGPSSAVPILKCFVSENEKPCIRCLDGLHTPGSKNDRNNPSLFLQVSTASTTTTSNNDDDDDEDNNNANTVITTKNVILDCGKTMRASILKFFLPQNIRTIDQVIISHDHADAYLGLLDLAPLIHPTAEKKIPLFSDEKTISKVKSVFPKVFSSEAPINLPSSAATTANNNNNFDCTPMSSTMKTCFPIFDTQIVTPGKKFLIGGGDSTEGIEVLPIHVLHGVNYFCLAFIFSLEQNGKLFENCETLVYISDTGDVTDKSRALIQQFKTKILILDMLKFDEGYISHFGHEAAVKEAKILAADQTFFIGTSHSVDRGKCEQDWKEAGLDSLSFAYDGLRVI